MAATFAYDRRRPENTRLYEIIRDNAEAFYAACETEGTPLPGFVKREVDVLACLSCAARMKLRSLVTKPQSIIAPPHAPCRAPTLPEALLSPTRTTTTILVN